jgi:hypothetical protein
MMWKSLTTGFFLICLTGCIQTKDELTINADGSGKVRIETRVGSESASMDAMTGAMGGGVIVAYPPISEAEVKKFFPGKDFKTIVKQETTDKGQTVTVVDAEFKDINSLLSSPYGRAHQLTVETNKDGLVVKAISGMEGIARMAEIKPGPEMGLMAMPGMDDMQKKKGEMRMEFRITLPNAVTGGNGVRDGKSAVWISERAKCKDAAEFVQQLGLVSEARCDGAGLKISPVTPARLGLRPFGELPAGNSAAKGAGPDTVRIAAAAKFVPYGVVVTRSVDLGGQGGDLNENSAQLVGAVVLPREFEPQKWGDTTLDEAVDAKGHDLKPTDPGQGSAFSYSGVSMDESEEADAEQTNTTSNLRHTVSFSFRPPDWKIKEIGKIKGSVALHYFGGAEVVKMTNAIAAHWILDTTQGLGNGAFDGSEKKINSPKLTEMGMPISLQMGMLQSGITMLTLQISGKKGVLVDAQVFDAQGKPWPTFFAPQNMGGGEGNVCQLIVPGSPPPPLSLAVVASGSGSSVDVPVLVEHIPLTP